MATTDCEPTYEELKQGRGKNTNRQAPYCEPTYEELKHVFFDRKPFHIPNCEPTYEELKPPETVWISYS